MNEIVLDEIAITRLMAETYRFSLKFTNATETRISSATCLICGKRLMDSAVGMGYLNERMIKHYDRTHNRKETS